VESARLGGGELLLGASAFAGKVQNTQTRRHYGHQARPPRTVAARWLDRAVAVGAVPVCRARRSHRNVGVPIPFQVAAQADVPSANIAYSFGQKGWLDDITCYNNSA
jgi:hypothetical protein